MIARRKALNVHTDSLNQPRFNKDISNIIIFQESLRSFLAGLEEINAKERKEDRFLL